MYLLLIVPMELCIIGIVSETLLWGGYFSSVGIFTRGSYFIEVLKQNLPSDFFNTGAIYICICQWP